MSDFAFVVTVLDKDGETVHHGPPAIHPNGDYMEILWEDPTGSSWDYMWQTLGPVRVFGDKKGQYDPLALRNWTFGV